MIGIIWILVLLIVIPILVYNVYTSTAPQFGRKPNKVKLVKLAKTSSYVKGKFRNLTDVPVILPKTYGKIIRMQFRKSPHRVPETAIPSAKPVFNDSIPSDRFSVIWLGHSSVLIRISDLIILTDPVFSKRASPVSFVGPESFKYTIPFSPETIPFPDIILISHDHFDHLDYKTITNYYAHVKSFIVPLGVKSHLVRWGVPKENIIELDWGSEFGFSDGLKFIAAPAQHFTGRHGQDNSTLWCSWVIKEKSGSIYFSGDSGYSDHFKETGEKYGPFDLAFIECGAYGKYWPYIHMVPEESAQAGLDVNAKVVLPIHWGKFNLAFHPWKEPVERFSAEANKLGIQFVTPIPGQEIRADEDLPQDKWWQNIN